MQIREQERLRKQLEEERRNQEEVEKFQKKFQTRKKHRQRHHYEEQNSGSFHGHYWALVVGLSGILLAFYYLILS
jgi:hypothetical protein